MSHTKSIDQYSLTGELLKTWPSIQEAARAVGDTGKSINGCLRGYASTGKRDERYKNHSHIKNRTMAMGFVWRYQGQPFERPLSVPLKPVGRTAIPVTLRKGNESWDFPNIRAANLWVAEQRGVHAANLLAHHYGYEVIKHAN